MEIEEWRKKGKERKTKSEDDKERTDREVETDRESGRVCNRSVCKLTQK
jgi:hypothetical protein